MNEITVLIVDDHPVVRDGMEAMFAYRGGFKVVGKVGDGESAVTFVKNRGAPNVVVMDIRMPGMDGFATLAKLQRFYPAIHVLLLAGMPLHAEEARAKEMRAGGYLSKSSAQSVICSAVKAIAADPSVFITDKWQTAGEFPLSAREIEVFQALANGASREQVALKLGISHETVKSHARAILIKLDTPNMANAIARGFQLGILRA